MSLCAFCRSGFALAGFVLITTAAQAELVLTMGGDLNLNTYQALPHPQGGYKWGKLRNYDQALRGLRPLVNGDLNFANIETVVSDRHDMIAEPGSKFPFVMHPNGLDAVIRAGFNLFSLSNNHSGDYGRQGLQETALHMERIHSRHPLIGWHGVAENSVQATTPWIQEHKSNSGHVYRIAFAAITGSLNWDFSARQNRPGVVSMYDRRAVATLLAQMKSADVDLRILSVHFGKEKVLEVEKTARDLYRNFVNEGQIDVLIGHHPHRVRPIERIPRIQDGEINDALIFYSLGNLLMFGAAALNELGPGHDYGLWAKVFFNWNSRIQKLVAQAVEVTALTDMHIEARPLTGAPGLRRIDYLNRITKTQFSRSGVLMQHQPDGSGVNCWGSNLGPRAFEVCGK